MTKILKLYLRKWSLNNGTGADSMRFNAHLEKRGSPTCAYARGSALPDGTSDAFLRATVPPERPFREKY